MLTRVSARNRIYDVAATTTLNIEHCLEQTSDGCQNLDYSIAYLSELVANYGTSSSSRTFVGSDRIG